MSQHLATCHCAQCLEEDRQEALHSKDGLTVLFAVLEEASLQEAVAMYLRNADKPLLRRAILAIANYRFGEAEVLREFEKEGNDDYRNRH